MVKKKPVLVPEAGGFEPNENPVAAVVAGAEAGAPPKEKDVPPPAAPDVPPPKENAILVGYKRLVDAAAGNSVQVVCFVLIFQREQQSNVFFAKKARKNGKNHS